MPTPRHIPTLPYPTPSNLFLKTPRPQTPSVQNLMPTYPLCSKPYPIEAWTLIHHRVLMTDDRAPPPHRFQQWPDDALDAVAIKFLSGVDVLPDQRRSLQAWKLGNCDIY